jgi:hypothetical protein
LPIDSDAAAGDQLQDVAVLEALLREAARAIQQNDAEMKKARQQLEQLESQQQFLLGLTCCTTKITPLSRQNASQNASQNALSLRAESISISAESPEQLRDGSRSSSMPALLHEVSPREDSVMTDWDERERSFLISYLAQKKIDRLTGSSGPGDLSTRSRGSMSVLDSSRSCGMSAPVLMSPVLNFSRQIYSTVFTHTLSLSLSLSLSLTHTHTHTAFRRRTVRF